MTSLAPCEPICPPRPVLVVLLSLYSMIGAMGMDLYLPSFHAIAQEFQVTAAQVQQSISVYMAATAISMLFYGSLSDTFGRRRVLLVSISGYALAALVCSLSPNFEVLVASRFSRASWRVLAWWSLARWCRICTRAQRRVA